MRGSRAASALVAAFLLAATIPPAADASTVFSYASMEMDGWITVKTFEVTAEATHEQDGADPVGLPSLPSSAESARASGKAEVCLIATSFVEVNFVRTKVREMACPRSLNGFRYDPNTFEAMIIGTVKTDLWTQRWEVVAGRWVIVKDKTVKRSATMNLRWRWSENPYMAFDDCGDGGAATGLGGEAAVSGSIRFNGAGVTARPSGHPGYLILGMCATP